LSYQNEIFSVGTVESWLKISEIVFSGSEQIVSNGIEFQLVSKSSPMKIWTLIMMMMNQVMKNCLPLAWWMSSSLKPIWLSKTLMMSEKNQFPSASTRTSTGPLNSLGEVLIEQDTKIGTEKNVSSLILKKR